MKHFYPGIIVTVVFAMTIVACDEKQPTPPPITNHETFSSTQLGDQFEEKIGQEITVIGQLENREVGPLLVSETCALFLDIDNNSYNMMMADNNKHPIKATGIIVLRHDLPVFILDPENAKRGTVRSGIPVPPGTDLHEASKRYVLENVAWEFVKDLNASQNIQHIQQ
ncbi:MAG: hypothetical protein CMJ19_07005 [Phycisphaeraceae bacterium]|nr:hypothetical protein [Phycisphaeraceae bacterium]